MVRVNTLVPLDLNEWLNQVSEKRGIPKSTLITMALEKYRDEQEFKMAIRGEKELDLED